MSCHYRVAKGGHNGNVAGMSLSCRNCGHNGVVSLSCRCRCRSHCDRAFIDTFMACHLKNLFAQLAVSFEITQKMIIDNIIYVL